MRILSRKLLQWKDTLYESDSEDIIGNDCRNMIWAKVFNKSKQNQSKYIDQYNRYKISIEIKH